MAKKGNSFNADQFNLWECCGQYYAGTVAKCRVCEKSRFDNRSPERSKPEPEQNKQYALDAKSQAAEALGQYTGKLCIVIERHSTRLLDDDNAIGGAKQMRDAIADLLGRKGDSEQDGLIFEYIQIKSKIKKTVIKFYKEIET